MRGNKYGRRGCGSQVIAARINSELLNSPSDQKLSSSTISNAVKRGHVGVSPPRWGREKLIPEVMTKGLAVHATMLQVSGNGEASKGKLKATADALTTGTKWEGKFDTDYVLRAARNGTLSSSTQTVQGTPTTVVWNGQHSKRLTNGPTG